MSDTTTNQEETTMDERPIPEEWIEAAANAVTMWFTGDPDVELAGA